MLWDIIRDWFVQHIWGGMNSNGEHFSNFVSSDYDTELLTFQIGNFKLSMGDWLSTTSTIIVLVLMCAFLFLVVRYLFRLTSGLIRGH